MKLVPTNARNRRVSSVRQRKQQHLLDVKIRESKERSRRFRTAAGIVFKLLVFVGVTGGAWFGGKEALRHFVWENPDYFLRDVTFTTDGTLTREQVLQASGIVEGQNIFTVKLADARAAIEKLPQVESSEVRRIMPNRVTIQVTERRPIAWVAAKGAEDPTASDKSFLIDARATVIRSRVVLPEYYHLPIISGVETENLAPGQRVNTFEMQSALELVRLNADSTRFQVRNIDLAKGYCLVVTDQRRAKITFGLDRIDAQLARLNHLLDSTDAQKKEIQTVNLFVERNLPVTFYDLEAEALAAAEAAAAAQARLDLKNQKLKPTDAAKLEPGKARSSERAKKPVATPARSSEKATPAPKPSSPSDRVKNPFQLNG